MIKIIIICINFFISILLVSLISWFETKKDEINFINSKHLRDIEKLKKIPYINQVIEKNLRPTLKVLPKTSEEADLKLIKFFDKHSDKYNFSVDKYIYHDHVAHYLEIKYSIDRDEHKALYNFMHLKFLGGFIKFHKFDVKKSTFTGQILLIQPYSEEDNNESK